MIVKPVVKIALFSALCVSILSLRPDTAQAQTYTKYTGAQFATKSGSVWFTATGDTIIVKGGSTPSYLTFPNTSNTLPQQVLAIDGIWVMPLPGETGWNVTDATGSNASVISGPGVSSISWLPESNPTGYAGKSGYGSNGTFIDIANAATLTSYGKTPTGYTMGVFQFPGLANFQQKYGAYSFYIGIDYLTAGPSGTGKQSSYVLNTGRAYIISPEPAAWIPFAVISSAIGGMIFLRRRRQLPSQLTATAS